MYKSFIALLCIGLCTIGCSPEKESKTVNVYSHRHYEIDHEIFQDFEEQTGIKVNVLKASADELIERIKREGEHSPADILLTVDGGRLFRSKESGLLQAIDSNRLTSNIPSVFKDPDHFWLGLTYRARTLVCLKKDSSNYQHLQYTDLASDSLNTPIFVRSSSNMYNQSFVAQMIHNWGKSKTENWLEGFVKNMGRKPTGNDRDQAKYMYQQQEGIAFMNTYYIGKMIHSKDSLEKRVGESLFVIYPNDPTTGTHINISGLGILKNAPHLEESYALINFLLKKEVQEKFATGNYEYPVNPEAGIPAWMEGWGLPTIIPFDFNVLGVNNSQAAQFMQNADWE